MLFLHANTVVDGQANCQRVAGCAMAFLAVLLIVYGKLLLGLVISVLVVADLVWFLRASNELEFVVVRPCLCTASWASHTLHLGAVGVQVLLQVANAALREHRGVLVLVGVAMAVQAAYSILWLMIGAPPLSAVGFASLHDPTITLYSGQCSSSWSWSLWRRGVLGCHAV